jgi:hypothetical protein
MIDILHHQLEPSQQFSAQYRLIHKKSHKKATQVEQY